MGKEESRDEDRHGEGRAGEIKQGRGAAEGIGGLGRSIDGRGLCTRSIFNSRREQWRGGQRIQGQRRGEENKGDEGRLIEEMMVGEWIEGQGRGRE